MTSLNASIPAREPAETPVRLASIDSHELKKLYRRSSIIFALNVLWIIGTALSFLLLPAWMEQADELAPVLGGIVVLGALLAIAASVGGFMRTGWGRVPGIIHCALILINIPVGTVIGILGLVAYSKGGLLFGPGAPSHAQVKQEFKRRKRAEQF